MIAVAYNCAAVKQPNTLKRLPLLWKLLQLVRTWLVLRQNLVFAVIAVKQTNSVQLIDAADKSRCSQPGAARQTLRGRVLSREC